MQPPITTLVQVEALRRRLALGDIVIIRQLAVLDRTRSRRDCKSYGDQYLPFQAAKTALVHTWTSEEADGSEGTEKRGGNEGRAEQTHVVFG